MSGYRIDELPDLVYVADAEAARVVPWVAVHCEPLATDGVQFGMTIPFGRNQPMKRRGTPTVAAFAFRDQIAEGRNGSASVTPAPERNNRRDHLLTPMLI
jgi:hypothetical protein